MNIDEDIYNKFSITLKIWGININNEIVFKFNQYFELLNNWNSKVNITNIYKKEDVFIKHFLDSISSCQLINYSNQRIIDIGTGGGFPGLPIKILFPGLKMCFIDSSKKKINVLNEICKELKITDCEFINDNVEKIGKEKKYRENFDISLIRAVSSISTLLEYSIPLLKISGISVLYKGPNVEKEVENSVNALQILDSKIKEKHEFILPFTNEKRKIIVVEKTGKTNEKFPRRIGIPKKRPL